MSGVKNLEAEKGLIYSFITLTFCILALIFITYYNMNLTQPICWVICFMERIKNAIFGHPITPFTDAEVKEKGEGFYHKGNEFVNHTNLHHSDHAFYRLSVLQKIFILSFVAVLGLGLFLNWKLTVIFFVSALTIIYFADLLFNLFLIIRSFSKPPELEITDDEIRALDENTLPKYTIMCPLYKEGNVLPQFVKAIRTLDYPSEKLEVLLLLEEDDNDTIDIAKNMGLPSYFTIVVIPHSKPKTKPKALNYGMKIATGEYAVIYDAEDMPETDQLKKVLLGFKMAGERTKCIQAKLNFYNPHQNVITKVFTAEYSLWFDLVLTGLQSIHAPIPLGGTSNHFRVRDLIELKGWDAFNVTEDCDLGMRLVKQGYRTAIVNSTTYEEANSGMMNWFWQRTRWIKGYMQTYLVHMRKPQDFVTHWREPHVITFQLIVGGKITSMLINPLMWILTISYFVFRAQIGTQIESFFPAPIFYMGLFSLVLGNFLYLYYYMIGCAKREQYELIKYAFLVPIYWLAMSLAAYTSLYGLIRTPHYWAKTKHGLHLNSKKNLVESVMEHQSSRVAPAITSS